MASDLLFSGILPRYPELKVISVESGMGFVPFVLEACDYTFEYGDVRIRATPLKQGREDPACRNTGLLDTHCRRPLVTIEPSHHPLAG